MSQSTPLRTGYRRIGRSTRHQHTAEGITVTHDHSAGGTTHWHELGSGAPSFGPGPGEQLPASRQVLVEVRTCGSCSEPVIYWDGDFRHLSPGCPH